MTLSLGGKEGPIRVKIELNKADIKRGTRSNWDACPIARAASRALRSLGLGDVRVYGRVMTATGTAGYHEIDLPRKAKVFIERFDFSEQKDEDFKYPRKSFQPFSFNINLNLEEN